MCNFVRTDTTCTHHPLHRKKAAQFLCRLVHADSGMKIISASFISSRPTNSQFCTNSNNCFTVDRHEAANFLYMSWVSESANENHYTKKKRCFLMEIYCSLFFLLHSLTRSKRKDFLLGAEDTNGNNNMYPISSCRVRL